MYWRVFTLSLSLPRSLQIIWSRCVSVAAVVVVAVVIVWRFSKYLDSHIHWKAKQSPAQYKPPPNSVLKCRSMFKFKCMTTKKNKYILNTQKNSRKQNNSGKHNQQRKKKVVSFHYEIFCIDSFSVRSLLSLSIYFAKDTQTRTHTPFTLVVMFCPSFFFVHDLLFVFRLFPCVFLQAQ